MDQDGDVSTLYEWAGGAGTFERLTAIFYDVLKDPLLRPSFENMPKEHSRCVTRGIAEIFGGPKPIRDILARIRRTHTCQGTLDLASQKGNGPGGCS